MIKVAIIGAENVGKSTLMNALLGGKISEVSEVPGTTKGTIKRAFGKIKLPKTIKNPFGGADELVLIDTAGLFDPEKEIRGKVLSEEAFKELINEIIRADIIIHMIDATKGLHRGMEKLHYILKFRYEKPIIVVINKIDLVPREKVEELAKIVEKRLEQKPILLSLVTYEGFNDLLKALVHYAQYAK
ncbi:GTP-binding protein [Pyrococcus furiosus DSM 3638]|uniref:GTP-binding protein n=3 Tax=Pyrococcus furiosus TaxID=2261 RepID=A0A5C0XMI5_PYRFU|nr:MULTISPECIES: Era-like GTP-binding protein [Pyrococcus]AAL80521.1 GTP-binding protein homologue [Pyrococcus furiosus DSM 3638]AFN03187.1 GTP-binding protein [Pyrococcus furiosus COM1]MDK2869271.1 GTPase [Pyrococcus sp.]QEK78113.1 GTP-binding protein [Pyrococcus furiosus DSM 3638]